MFHRAREGEDTVTQPAASFGGRGGVSTSTMPCDCACCSQFTRSYIKAQTTVQDDASIRRITDSGPATDGYRGCLGALADINGGSGCGVRPGRPEPALR
jgi:hypothetical protein